MAKQSWSWGNYPLAEHKVYSLDWPNSELPELVGGQSVLPFGCGRSYGDVAINDGNVLLRTTSLSRFIEFDADNGILRCESGVTLENILKLIVPRGWFLPVTPGTQYVTVGGAIANDVHGKNHHRAGNFGNHVLGFELLRSNEGRVYCSPEQNSELFCATLGGIGLTGLILTVGIQLMRIPGDQMDLETIPFQNFDEGVDLFLQHSESSTYTVAWIDCLSQGKSSGRGIFSRAEHCEGSKERRQRQGKVGLPFYLPNLALNKWSVQLFNEAVFRKGVFSKGRKRVSFKPFFYPLDSISYWNRIYGRGGFFQYQFAIPFGSNDEGRSSTKKILEHIASSGNASFLAVLKTFGEVKPLGMMSFPLPGITLALDFPNKGPKTLKLLDTLDRVVEDSGGRVYPAKDARMSPKSFQNYYPNWHQFSQFIDPAFDSSFWRRVTRS